MNTINIRLPDSLYEAAKKLAKKEHISLNQFITLAIAEKLSALGAKEFLKNALKELIEKSF